MAEDKTPATESTPPPQQTQDTTPAKPQEQTNIQPERPRVDTNSFMEYKNDKKINIRGKE